MNIGYIRVSTKEQNTARQYQAFADYEKANDTKIDRTFEDKASGSNFNRDSYKAMKLTLRQGDTLIIKELDRLGRNMEEVKKEWQDIQSMGIDIVVIDTPILNTQNKTDLERSLISNIVFELLAYLSEKERTKIKERQREGIDIAKQQGKFKGRKPVAYDVAQFRAVCGEWREGKITARAAMDRMNMKPNKFYNEVKALGI